MKSIDRNLYDRNGHYYYRTALPRNLHKLLLITEIRIALATQDLTQDRMSAAQLDFEVTRQGIALIHKLGGLNPDHSLESVIAEFKQNIDRVKSNAGYNPIRRIKGMGMLGGCILFSQIADKYLADCPLDAVSTRFYKVATFALFKELIGNKPFRDINQTDAQQFKAYLLKLPANAKKTFKIDSFENFDWNLVKDAKPQNPRTINNRLMNMSTLINWAERGGYYHQKNPFSRMTIRIQNKAKNRRHPFKIEELQTLFSCPIYTGCHGNKPNQRLMKGDVIIKDNLYWVPLIGLYSGMRLNEICQLYTSDIRLENDILIFDINADGDDKDLKTEQSKRYVPVHNKLIDLGFLDYVAKMKMQGRKRLFPDIPFGKSAQNYSSTFTKRFWRMLRDTELKRDGLCFHSLRHTFIDGMRNCSVERSIVMAITGHQTSKDVHDSYGYGYNLARLHEGINKLSFPKIEASSRW